MLLKKYGTIVFPIWHICNWCIGGIKRILLYWCSNEESIHRWDMRKMMLR